jgi:molecular chaperone GrpE
MDKKADSDSLKDNEIRSQEKISGENLVELKESEYRKLSEEAASYKDKYIRICAEFDNARKRMEREKQEFVKYANEGLIAEFLNILDDLERSVQAASSQHEDYEAFLKGIEMVMAHVYEMLKKNGVTPVEAKGKPFDPHYHEVLMQEETSSHEDGAVLEEFQKGYLYNDRVIRTAKVKVARRTEGTNEQIDQSN